MSVSVYIRMCSCTHSCRREFVHVCKKICLNVSMHESL